MYLEVFECGFSFYHKDRYSSISSLMEVFLFYRKESEGFGKEHKDILDQIDVGASHNSHGCSPWY